MAKLQFKYGAMNGDKSDMLIKTACNGTEQDLAIIPNTPSVNTKGDITYDSLCGSWRMTRQATVAVV